MLARKRVTGANRLKRLQDYATVCRNGYRFLSTIAGL
jgi:hypothetical protein